MIPLAKIEKSDTVYGSTGVLQTNNYILQSNFIYSMVDLEQRRISLHTVQDIVTKKDFKLAWDWGRVSINQILTNSKFVSLSKAMTGQIVYDGTNHLTYR